MDFYEEIKQLVGDNFYLIEDKFIYRVKELCDNIEKLCAEIDPQFYGAFFDKEDDAFCITVGVSDATLKKNSVFWKTINDIDAIRFTAVAQDGKTIYQALGTKDQIPEIEIWFYIYLKNGE